MDKKIEPKDTLFIRVDDINKSTWVINKRHIVSAGAPLAANAITRIVLTTGAIIDTYTNIGFIIGAVSDIEHRTEQDEKA